MKPVNSQNSSLARKYQNFNKALEMTQKRNSEYGGVDWKGFKEQKENIMNHEDHTKKEEKLRCEYDWTLLIPECHKESSKF